MGCLQPDGAQRAAHVTTKAHTPFFWFLEAHGTIFSLGLHSAAVAVAVVESSRTNMQ